MLVIAFRIALTLDVKKNNLVVRWLFVSTKSITMQFLGVADFKGLILAVYRLSLIYLPKTETIFNFVYPLWTQSSIMISGTQIYSTLFLA